MALDTVTPRSRRTVLAASLGGLAALAANAIGRPALVRANDPNDVLLGGVNTTGSRTTIRNTTTGNAVLSLENTNFGLGLLVSTSNAQGILATTGASTAVEGDSDTGYGVVGASNTGTGVWGVVGGAGNGVEGHGSGTGVGVYGHSGIGVANVPAKTGVYGRADQDANARGVFGQSTVGQGVHGESGSSIGVLGLSTSGIGTKGGSAQSVGVVGSSDVNCGIVGQSGAGPSSAPARTGIFGYCVTDANARGVSGQSTSGRGVYGQATSGLGVRGFATSGVGLSGEAATGYALRTMGRVRLDKSAGQATIASGASSVAVTPGIDLTSTSAVVATLNGDAGGSVAVKRVSINTTANTFTIVLTGNATASVKVAWLVVG
jgi:hypothetical protein